MVGMMKKEDRTYDNQVGVIIQRDCVVAKEITNGSHNGAGEGEEEDVDQTGVEVIVEGTRG